MAKATMGLRGINLVGKARDNEIKFSELSPKDKISMLEAMKHECRKWTEFKATKYVRLGAWLRGDVQAATLAARRGHTLGADRQDAIRRL